MEDDTHCNDVCVLYKPRSDFIILSKLNVLGLARKLEAGKREESQRTPTLKGWIWENVVGVMDTILSSVRMKFGAKKKPDGDIEVKNTSWVYSLKE